MSRPTLFVRSKRTTVITGHVSVESMGGVHTTTDYAEGSTHAILSREDSRAVELLRASGVRFDRVDLSKGVWSNLVARYRGVSSTPTLLDKNPHPQLYVGVSAISQYLVESGREKTRNSAA